MMCLFSTVFQNQAVLDPSGLGDLLTVAALNFYSYISVFPNISSSKLVRQLG